MAPPPRQGRLAVLALACWIALLPGVVGLAGQRRKPTRAKQGVPSRWSGAATAESNNNNNENLEVLWGMAGTSSRKKRQRGRKPTKEIREDGGGIPAAIRCNAVDPTNTRDTVAPGTIKASERGGASGGISREEIASAGLVVSEAGPLRGEVTLTNGTVLSVDPRDLHQRDDHEVWMALRGSLNVTASEMSAVVGNSIFTTRDKLLEKKLAPPNDQRFVVNSKACEWGLRMEPKAMRQYCEVTGNDVTETGLHVAAFGREDAPVCYWGASPDGLVVDAKDGSEGLLEIKSLWGRRHKKELPQFEHCPSRFWDQIQGQLAVCDREWCDLIMYIPPSHKNRRNYCIMRIPRDRDYWDGTLSPALEEFCAEVQELREKAALPQ